MAEVPDDERAGGPGERRDAGDIRDESRAVGDVAEHDHGRVVAEQRLQVGGGDARIRVDPRDGESAFGGNALDKVSVRGEVVAVDHDLCASRAGVDRGADQFVEQHGGRVTDGDLASCGPQHDAAEVVADCEGQPHPRFPPSTDEASRPLIGDERGHAVAARGQRAAERVAVEVGDDLGVAEEKSAMGGERIGAIEVGCGGHPSSLCVVDAHERRPAASLTRECSRRSHLCPFVQALSRHSGTLSAPTLTRD